MMNPDQLADSVFGSDDDQVPASGQGCGGRDPLDRSGGPAGYEADSDGYDEEAQDQWDAHHDGTCNCHDFFWLKGVAHGADTIAEVIEAVAGFLNWLEGREKDGFELEQPVEHGHGYLVKGPVAT
jgi:hypothetical protein